MKCVKVFNNSAVSTVMPDGREAIVLGKGIGFGKRPGDTVNEGAVEKVYYVQNEMQTKFLQMLEGIHPDVMEAAEEIIGMAEQEGFSMSNQATISLIDHISFSIERQNTGLSLPYLLLGETQMLYQREYELGRRALEIIRRKCGVTLPEDEAGYIALHLVTISTGRSEAYDTLKFVKGTMDIIQETYGISLDPKSLDATRLITHLKFLAQRIFQGSGWDDSIQVEDMYQLLLRRDPRHKECLARIGGYIRETFGYILGSQEAFYLLVHLTKILSVS